MTVQGKDKVQYINIVLLQLGVTFFLLFPFICFSSKIQNYLLVGFMLVGFVILNYLVFQGFKYRIRLIQNELEIKRYFYKFEYYKDTFVFQKITTNNLNWIKFTNNNKSLLFEEDNGMENGTLHIHHDNFESIEIGEKNNGLKIISKLLNELDKNGF
jgi:hypothetical protein